MVHIKDVVSRWNGESSKKRKDISLGIGVKIAGQEFSHGSVNIACYKAAVEGRNRSREWIS